MAAASNDEFALIEPTSRSEEPSKIRAAVIEVIPIPSPIKSIVFLAVALFGSTFKLFFSS